MRLFIQLILSVFLTSGLLAQEVSDVVKVGDKAPNFTVKTISGKTLCISDLKGKYILVNFFATWCKPCMEEMPLLEKNVQQRFASDDFVLISIGREHNLNELELFNERKKFTFHIAADPQRSIYSLYAEKYIPRNYLISPTGELIYAKSGFESNEFEKLIQLIEKKLSK